MTFKEYLEKSINSDDFIYQLNLVPYCDFFYESNFFCEANKDHFGIKDLDKCLKEAPDCSAVIMCRFKDGEVLNLIETCRQKKDYKYIIVQTIIGDDGFITNDTLVNLPKNILKIFSKNVYFDHKKLIPIPIGRDWRNVSENIVKNYSRTNLKNYSNLVYLNFSLETNKTREEAYNILKNNNWITVNIPEKYGVYKMSHSAFLDEMYKHKFTLSPAGKALDCYRTWDALFTKSIPILDYNNHTKNWRDLPVIIVKDWNSITEDFLNKKFKSFFKRKFSLEKLTASYWGELIIKEKSNF